jgi:hypothetical protein
MLSDLETAALHKAYGRAYLLGLILCVCWPLILVLMLGAGAVKPGPHPTTGVFLELGYTFTLLTFAAAAFVTWRSGKVRKGFRELEPGLRPRILFREVVLYSALFELSCVYGLIYWMLVGLGNHKHPFSFIMLTPLMFFFFVPRFEAWRTAAEG